jgi:hypothetical protein
MDDQANRGSDPGDSAGEPPLTCSEVPHGSRAWKIDVQARIVQMGVELEQLAQRRMGSSDWWSHDSWDAIVQAARRELDQACAVLRKKDTLRSFFTGNNIDIAYSHIHAAGVYVSRLQTQEELLARAPYLAAKARSLLPAHSQRREVIEALVEPKEHVDLYHPGAYELAFVQALENLQEIGDQRYSQLRRFRNNLRLVGVLLLVIVAALVVIGYLAPDAIPLCFRPQGAAQMGDVVEACPTSEERLGETASTRDASILGSNGNATDGAEDDDVLVVVLLGIVGGALSGALAAKSFRPPPNTPYNLPLYSFLFKLPVGALTALGGLILLTGEIVPGLSALDSQGQVLAYALLFGFAQHLFTRYLDEHAMKILLGVPAKSRSDQDDEGSAADE